MDIDIPNYIKSSVNRIYNEKEKDYKEIMNYLFVKIVRKSAADRLPGDVIDLMIEFVGVEYKIPSMLRRERDKVDTLEGMNVDSDTNASELNRANMASPFMMNNYPDTQRVYYTATTNNQWF